MGSRTDWLTDFAKPFADELAKRMGSQKRVLSAGILALYDLTPEQREYYMAKAVGQDLSEKETKELNVPITENIEVLKHFIRYKIPNTDEKRLLDSLRNLLTEDPVEKNKRKKIRSKGA